MKRVFIICLLLAAVPAHATNNQTSDIEALRQRLEQLQNHYEKELAVLRQQLEQLNHNISAAEATSNEELDERLGAIESDVDDLLMRQDSSGDSQATLDIDMYATLEYENFANTDSAFDARNVELVVSGRMTDRLSGVAEIEFERLAESGGSSNRVGDVEVEQGWVEYYVNDAFKPRVGVILVPFGSFNAEHFDVTQELVDKPLVMRRVIPVPWSEAGAGFNGEIRALNNIRITYDAYFINGLTNHFSDTGLRDARGAFGNDNNGNKAFAGHVEVEPFTGLNIGFSGYTGNYGDSGNSGITGLGLDFNYQWHALQFRGEYARFDLDDGVEADGITAAPQSFKGYYLETNYRFWPELLNDSVLSRGFSNPLLTLSLRYGMASIDDDGDPGIGDNRERRWTIGLNYRPVPSYVFKLEYQFNNSRNEGLEHGDNDGFQFSASAAF